jgi:hypothetical protein
MRGIPLWEFGDWHHRIHPEADCKPILHKVRRLVGAAGTSTATTLSDGLVGSRGKDETGIVRFHVLVFGKVMLGVLLIRMQPVLPPTHSILTVAHNVLSDFFQLGNHRWHGYSPKLLVVRQWELVCRSILEMPRIETGYSWFLFGLHQCVHVFVCLCARVSQGLKLPAFLPRV